MEDGKEKKTIPKINEPVLEKPKSQIRQVVIETDGNTVKIVKAEVAGLVELRGILEICLKAVEGQPRSNQ